MVRLKLSVSAAEPPLKLSSAFSSALPEYYRKLFGEAHSATLKCLAGPLMVLSPLASTRMSGLAIQRTVTSIPALPMGALAIFAILSMYTSSAWELTFAFHTLI